MNSALVLALYVVAMIAIFCIFNARGIVTSKKIDISRQNNFVKIVKIVSTAVLIFTLTAIYYI